jgi:hypothetical protein
VINVKVAREAMSEWSRGDASDIDGKTERSSGAFGKGDIEGKAARVAASELGKRTSFKWAGAHEVSVGHERASTFQSSPISEGWSFKEIEIAFPGQ